MLSEKQRTDWQKRLIVFEHLCKENNIEVTDFMKEDFVRILEEMRKYDAKIHEDSTNYWGETKKRCFDLTNLFLASKEYVELRNTYSYLRISSLEYNDAPIIKIKPQAESFKHIISDKLIYALKIEDKYKLKVIIPLIYAFINYSIITQVKNFETQDLVVNLYDFISYMINLGN